MINEFYNEYLKNLERAKEIYKELIKSNERMDETYKQYFEDIQIMNQRSFNFFCRPFLNIEQQKKEQKYENNVT